MAKFSTGDLFDNRYQLLKELGGGQDAEVWTALDTLADEVIVLKIFVRVGEKALDSFFDDFRLLRNLKHDHILKPRDIGKWESQPYQKLDFLKNGSAFKRVEDEKPFSEQEAAEFLAQVSSALAYLHQNDIVHCDVKPENVLLKDDGSYALTDFGISKKMKGIFARVTMGKNADTSTFGLSRAYAPPEVSNTTNVKASRDIFSLGVSLYELLTCELPFDRDGGRALLMGVPVPDLPDTFSAELNSLIHKTLSKDLELRPTAQQLTIWANHYLETNTWDLTNEISEATSIPSKKPTTVISRKPVVSNPKPTENTKVSTNYKKWILVSLGVLVLLLIIYFTTRKTDEVPAKDATNANDTTVAKSFDSAKAIPMKTDTNKPAPVPLQANKITNDKSKIKNQPVESLANSHKDEPNQISDEQSQRLEDLLNDGELAINENNNKSAAIQYFTQARFIKQQYKLSNNRIDQLYRDYVKKGDAIFATELYSQAKAWYQVAQSLKNTDDIKQKIEACNPKTDQ